MNFILQISYIQVNQLECPPASADTPHSSQGSIHPAAPLSLGYDVKAASVALLLLSSLMLLCYLFLFLFHYYFFSVPGEKLRSTSSELFASFAMKVYRD